MYRLLAGPSLKSRTFQRKRDQGYDGTRVESLKVTCTSMEECRHSNRRTILRNISLLSVVSSISSPPAADALGFKKDLKKARRFQVPESEYKKGPDGLLYYDIVPGKGAEAKEGERVVIHFEVKWRGITFVTSRQGLGVTGGSPLGFDVGAKQGAGGTLKGIDLGVRGMRIGGRRLLKVPAGLAYGSRGYGEIPPNAVIDVDMELLSIKTSAVGFRTKLVEG